MTTPAPSGMPTAATVLFGQPERATDALTRALADRKVLARFGPALPRLSPAATRMLHDRPAKVVADLLADIHLADVLLGVWKTHAVLVEAARRTVEDPGSEELVDLAAHRINSVHHPRVDVLVDNVAAGSVEFELQLEVVVRVLVAHVRGGHLSALEGGRFRLSASLSCFEAILAAGQTELELAAVIDLGSGIPLVRDPAALPAR